MADQFLSPAEAARRLGISAKALRLYEERGLVAPVRSKSGWRIYGPEQIARLHQVLALKRLGLPLARIAGLITGSDGLDHVLALQERALTQEGTRVARALALVQTARKKLAEGAALSIDDLATLTTETTMTTKLTRKALFAPYLSKFVEKHFTPAELEEIADRDDFDQEKSIRDWNALYAELRTLAANSDPTSVEAQDFGRRWLAQSDRSMSRNRKFLAKMQNMAAEARADPETAAKMPINHEGVAFLMKVMKRLVPFGPLLTPIARKYFTEAELEALTKRENHEKLAADWDALIPEIHVLAAKGDPASPEALDLGRRWTVCFERFTGGDTVIGEKMINTLDESRADPEIKKLLMLSPEGYAFVGKILKKLKDETG